MNSGENPHDLIVADFAHKLGKFLNASRKNNKFKELRVAAEPKFLGLIKSELDAETTKCVRGWIRKDLQKETTRQIINHEKNIKLLMTKKELELVQSGSPANVRFHSAARLKTFIKLSRKLRNKYRDLTRLQRVAQKPSQNYRTIEKAKVFEDLLKRFENQYQRYEPLENPRGT
jgi:hypothetical protein